MNIFAGSTFQPFLFCYLCTYHTPSLRTYPERLALPGGHGVCSPGPSLDLSGVGDEHGVDSTRGLFGTDLSEPRALIQRDMKSIGGN